MRAADKVLSIAQGELGVKESPAGSNRVKYNTWFYGREVQDAASAKYPWCMAFVQWCFAQAGRKLPYTTASCSALLNWYKRNRPESVVKTPRPGDIVIYSFGHTGIVESGGNGTITAIEGNTSASGSQSNGGEVLRKRRNTSLVTGYIRPYEKEVNSMDNTPSTAHKEGVEWAKEAGILMGDASGDLKLSQPVTRQQMATMLHRFAKWLGKI